MNTMSEIEQAVRYLSRDQQHLLLDWLAGELDSELGVAEPTANYGGAAEARELFTLEEYFEMEEKSSIRSDESTKEWCREAGCWHANVIHVSTRCSGGKFPRLMPIRAAPFRVPAPPLPCNEAVALMR